MFNNASSTSTMPMLGPVDQGNTLAFAKLQGDDVAFYMQSLEITIGRIYPHKKHADFSITYDETVAMYHAVLYYDFYTMRYSLTVTGRSGVFVQEKLVTIGTTVPLKHNDSIQIGDAKFKFILPNNKVLEQTRSISQPRDYKVPTVEAVSGDDNNKVVEQTTSVSQSTDYRVPTVEAYSEDDDNEALEQTGSASQSTEVPTVEAVSGNDNHKIREQTRSVSQPTDYRVPTVEAVSGDDDSSDFYSVKSDDEDSTSRNNTVNHNWTNDYIVKPEEDDGSTVSEDWTNDYTAEPEGDDDSTVSEDWTNGYGVKPNDEDSTSDECRSDYADIINSYKHKPDEPPFPLYIIIACAILERGNHTFTVSEIRKYILNNYPYYNTMSYEDFREAVHSNFYHKPIKFVSKRVGHNNFLWSIAEGYEEKVKEQVCEFLEKPTAEPYIAIERPRVSSESISESSYESSYEPTYESTPEPTPKKSEPTRHRQIIPNAVHIPPSTVKKIDAYRNKQDEPPFALPVLIMSAMHESGKGSISLEVAIKFLHTNFPFYKNLEDQNNLRKKINQHFNGKYFSFAGTIDQELTFKMNPDRPYDIEKYVRKAIKNELKVKKYFETVGDRKVVYNLDVIHDYKFQKEEPPFSYCILAAYAINESPSNEVTMAYILDFIHKHFPFYKTVNRRILQFRVRASMMQKNNVIVILPNRHEVLYALNPDMSKERVIHSHINACLQTGNFLNRASKRIKLDDE